MLAWFKSSLSNHVLRDHVLIGGVVSALTVPLWGWVPALLMWLANIFLDVDHYIDFVWRTKGKNWGIKDMLLYHLHLFDLARKRPFLCLEVFHTAEFWLALGLITFWSQSPFLCGISAGVAMHILIDFIHLAHHGLLAKRANSVFEYLIRVRQERARGINLTELYDIAYRDLIRSKKES